MGFLTSTTPDITEGMPATLSSRLAATISTFRNVAYDFTIGGIGFCYGPEAQYPRNAYQRQSVPVQKQQQDNSKEPGEQSLDGYWIRSQNSWHRGTGINFYEPGSETDTQYRFADSSGIDVWTKGKASALYAMKKDITAGGNCYVQDAGNGYFVYTDDTSVLGWKGGSSYTLNTPAAGHTGRYYFFGYKKYVKVGWNATPSATVGIWNGGTNTVIAGNAKVEPLVWYFKDRIIAAHGKDLYEVPLNAPTAVDLQGTSGLYNPTDANTSWVDAAEGPNAIYLAYTDGTKDGIVRFSLADASSGQTPKLSQAYRVLDLPTGERIYKMLGYLGRYLILSTSAGIRICAVDSAANLTMGQVTIPAATTGRFNSLHADSSFVYVGGADVPVAGTSGGTTNIMGWTTAAGFIRINLGEPIGDINDLRFAYATDIRTTVNGTVTSSVRLAAGQQALAVTGSGVWITDTANYVSGGYLVLGRVRYDTLVPKVYCNLDLGGDVGSGTLKVQMFDEKGNEEFALTMDSSTGIFDTLTLDLTKRHIYVQVAGSFTWTAGAAPYLSLVQLRAMPTPRRLRQIRIPLKCYDRENDSRGVAFGTEDFAYMRLAALEQLEEAGVPVQVTDHRSGETFTAMIDEIAYLNTVAPERGKSNYDGTLSITLTRLA